MKWHWKSKQGKASLVWEEAQIVAGKNADMHRQDLWDAIESGNGPEWELGVQIVDEEKALAYGFDLLDPTTGSCTATPAPIASGTGEQISRQFQPAWIQNWLSGSKQ